MFKKVNGELVALTGAQEAIILTSRIVATAKKAAEEEAENAKKAKAKTDADILEQKIGLTVEELRAILSHYEETP